MGILDFLFEGKPPPNTTTTSVTGLPQWLSDYAQQIVGQGAAVAAQPYQAYQGPRLAGLNADQIKGFDVTRGSIGQAPGAIQQAQGQPGALTAAQPYIDSASQTLPGNIDKYMDPYISNVVDYAGTLANRQLNEKFLPSVSNYFGANGSSGSRSTQMRKTVDQGVRDLTEGLQQQGLAALSQGYQTAGQQFQADQSRLGTLGQLAGTFASNQRGQNADLAGALQKAVAGDTEALEGIGATQQADTQKSLDLAYNDFQQQRDYPKEQLGWLTQLLSGNPASAATARTTTGPGNNFQPSTAATLGSAATGIAGLLQAFKGMGLGSGSATAGQGMTDIGAWMARGGRVPVRRYARGGRVRGKGALRYAHA